MALSRLADRLVAADPALVRLYMAVRATASVGVALAILIALRRVLHFELSAALVGVPLGMIGIIALTDTVHREQKRTTLFLSLPMAASIAAATFAEPYRFLSDALFVIVLFLGMYLRKYGPRGAASGAVMVVGFFFALVFRIPTADLPWAFFAIALTAACTYVFRFVVFPDNAKLSLRNAEAAFRARQRLIAGTVATAAARGHRNRKAHNTLELDLRRLNETALVLNDIVSIPSDRLRVLEAELSAMDAVDNNSEQVEPLELPPDVPVVPDWSPRGLFRTGTQIDTGRISANLRQAIQISAAGILAIIAGQIVSAQRWYWAVLTAFFVFVGTSSSSETRMKAWTRIVGTMFGVAIGILLSYPLRGHERFGLFVLMTCVFGAVYTVRWSNAFFTFFITIVIATIYILLGLFTDELLALRLAETAVGGILGGIAAALLLPISGKRVLFNVTIEALKRLDETVTSAVDFMDGDAGADPIEATRKLDDALQSARVQLEQVLSPLRSPANLTYETRVALFTACANYARALAKLAYERPAGCNVQRLREQRDAIHNDIQAILAFNDGAPAIHLAPVPAGQNADGQASGYLVRIDRALHGFARTLGAV